MKSCRVCIECAAVKSCPLSLVLSVPLPGAHQLSPMCPLTQPAPGMKDMRVRHMGAGGRYPAQGNDPGSIESLGPLLTCQLALARYTAFWEGVGLLRKGCVSELQLA